MYASRVLAYPSGSDDSGPSSTTALAVMEAFRFSKFVMGIDVGGDVIDDPQLRGCVSRLLVEKSNYKQGLFVALKVCLQQRRSR